ncbi:putative membrane protein [Propionispora sp. 2/2-37]|uniref:LmeA family phospholipid-binding protein n=1 Tax=Propionispora sp. 2/2-37 TaxID=1677858 RepID=UPI0006BB5754|nr:DUF2993 domain-containing protein [Propionispora sp. 2/2-37]CUH94400.1 putative membrane protein [Propionispora sp. 2/2-37]
MSKRLIVILLLSGLALVVLSQWLLPSVLSRVMTNGLMELVHSDQVAVKLEKTPGFLMLGGGFDTITLDAAQAQVDKLTFSELHAVLTDVQLDMPALLGQRAVKLTSVGTVDLAVVLTANELAAYLNQSVKGIRNAAVTVTPDKVQVSSNFSIGGFANLAITLEGKVVGNGQKITFVTERFLLNNNLVGNLGGAVLTEIPLVDLKKLAFNVSARDVVMEHGKVTIHTDNRSR